MIKLTKENVDALFNEHIDMLRAVSYKYLYRYNGLYLFDKYDLLNETYIKVYGVGEVTDSEHFLAICFQSMKRIAIDMIFRGSWKKGVIEFNPNFHQYGKGDINGYNEDEYLKSVLGDYYDENFNYTTDDIKNCIEKIKNPTQKRLINLLSYNIDMERIRDITGIQKQATLRKYIYDARKTFFSLLQKRGIYKDVEYENITKFSNRHEGYKTSLEEFQMNKHKYLLNDYPIDGKMPEKILFILQCQSPIKKSKLIALIHLNEIETTEENTFRPHVTNTIKNLHEKGLIHIDKNKFVYYNGHEKSKCA